VELKETLSENIAVKVYHLESFRQAVNHEALSSVEIISAAPHKTQYASTAGSSSLLLFGEIAC